MNPNIDANIICTMYMHRYIAVFSHDHSESGHIGGVIHVLSVVKHSTMDREHHCTLHKSYGDQLTTATKSTRNNRNMKGPLVNRMYIRTYMVY